MPAARLPERLHRRSLIASIRIHGANSPKCRRDVRDQQANAHQRPVSPYETARSGGSETPPDLVHSHRNDRMRFDRSDSVNRNRC
jgi:hypothetical protein